MFTPEFLAALSNDAVGDATTTSVQLQRTVSHGDRTLALANEFRDLKKHLAIATGAFSITSRRPGRRRAKSAPTQAQLFENYFIPAADVCRRAGADISNEVVRPSDLAAFITGGEHWASLFEQQEAGDWCPDQKLKFAQAAAAMHSITSSDFGGHPPHQLSIEGWEPVLQVDGSFEVTVSVRNLNWLQLPATMLVLGFTCGFAGQQRRWQKRRWQKRRSNAAQRLVLDRFRFAAGPGGLELENVRLAFSHEIDEGENEDGFLFD